MSPSLTTPLLEVQDLKVHFKKKKKLLSSEMEVVYAVDGVSFSIQSGKTLGIVGESGSGKSTTALAVMQLTPITAGKVLLNQRELNTLKGEELRLSRQDYQLVFQDAYSSLNPRERVGEIIGQPLKLMKAGNRKEQEERVKELFKAVGLSPEQAMLFPHQFSGGQRQRIGFARALATHPKLIVCDEPVSALDVAIQAQILNLMRRLQEEYRLTYLFISHDLGVVQYICDDIAVMYLGKIVEQGSRVSLFQNPRHPYTLALLSSVPNFTFSKGKERIPIIGDPPSPINPPPGCSFAERCPLAISRCRAEKPELRVLPDGNKVACHRINDQGEQE